MRRQLTSSITRAGRPAAIAALAVLALLGVAILPTPAGAQGTIDPQGAALSTSASCSQGDIEITYSARGVERQITDFTADDGRVLHHYDARVYASNHDGVEYILSQTNQPPAAGSLLAVHVSIGSSPADASSGEFFVAYRCDTRQNDQGGNNQVVFVCTGLFGTCPTSVAEYLDQRPSGPTPATPVRAVPTFTG